MSLTLWAKEALGEIAESCNAWLEEHGKNFEEGDETVRQVWRLRDDASRRIRDQ